MRLYKDDVSGLRVILVQLVPSVQMTLDSSVLKGRLMKIVVAILVMLSCMVWSQESAVEVAEDLSDPVVLRVGDREETLSDFNERFEIAILSLAAAQGISLDEAIRAQLEGFKPQFLERRSTELVLLQEAQVRDIVVSQEFVDGQIAEIMASLPEAKSFESFLEEAGFKDATQLKEYIYETEMLQSFVASLQEEIIISEEELKLAYENRQNEFQTDERVCARHILLETEELAKDLLAQLAKGADFAELASMHSIDPSGASTGGDLRCYGRGQMVAPFEEASFAAELDTPVGPVQSQFGYHLILVYDRQAAGPQPLEVVRPSLEQSLKQEKFTSLIDALRASATVETFPELLNSAD